MKVTAIGLAIVLGMFLLLSGCSKLHSDDSRCDKKYYDKKYLELCEDLNGLGDLAYAERQRIKELEQRPCGQPASSTK